MNITFVGLGIMGRPMALNLLKGGHALRVNARRPESMQPLKEAGATACASPAEAARGSEVIFTMVSDTPDVEQVIFGPGGVAEGAARGSVIVDMSTISHAWLLARIGCAPGRQGRGDAGCSRLRRRRRCAINGTLSIMVGGKPEVFSRVAAAVRVHGQEYRAHRSQRRASVAKALQSDPSRRSHAQSLVAEALTLARKNGVDPGRGARWRCWAASPGASKAGGPRQPPHRRARLPTRLQGPAASEADLRIVTARPRRNRASALPQAALVAQHPNALVGTGCAGDRRTPSAVAARGRDAERIEDLTRSQRHTD